MRNSPVVLAIVAAIGAIYGCSLPREGLFADPSGGGGAPSVTSAGGGQSVATGSTATATTSTGGTVVTCTLDSDCTGGTTCKAPRCTNGACEIETASLDGAVCEAAAGPCFDESQCAGGDCVPRPKAAAMIDDDTPGNCTSLACDGSGASTPVANTADLPTDQDSSDCAVPVCNGTTAGTKTLTDGAGCGNNQHCLAGQCKECASDSHCGNDLSSCTTAVCNAGKCGQKDVPNGNACGIGGKCASGACCIASICGGGSECCIPFQHCNAADHCTF
jgi:hypothetical protein